eukprot:CAMPEP_0206418540 /NCGR_PEP_ID=MMETSP0294-20121207/38082_1 /ASSEMBLY_ACC=CAM_ASM_000327 /TAXON_ID=39354 /ORGANISM="Heterosigma akashiwo, Strain CCMP2393" /LENGTH=182 /DNA_ID=CAMNT_0053881763 /DNA_START=131 /DNA_END=680 /DNA_ORIENTATION=-
MAQANSSPSKNNTAGAGGGAGGDAAAGARVYLAADYRELALEMRAAFAARPDAFRPVLEHELTEGGNPDKDNGGISTTITPTTAGWKVPGFLKMVLVVLLTLAVIYEKHAIFTTVLGAGVAFILTKKVMSLAVSPKGQQGGIMDRMHNEGWLTTNPIGVPSERDVVCETVGRVPYRCMFEKI